METKIVKCPKCGTLMRLSNPNGEAMIHFVCPKCNTPLNVAFNNAGGAQPQAQQQPQAQRQPQAAPQPQQAYGGGPATVYERGPANNGAASTAASHGETQYYGGAAQSSPKPSAGYILYGSLRLPLQPGSNIVGRKAGSSHANVQIPTADRFMSRHHSRIDVLDVGTGHYRVLISNAENKNATFVNGQLLGMGEQFILADGATIRMGETTVVYRV